MLIRPNRCPLLLVPFGPQLEIAQKDMVWAVVALWFGRVLCIGVGFGFSLALDFALAVPAQMLHEPFNVYRLYKDEEVNVLRYVMKFE